MISPRGAGRQPQTFLRMAVAWVVRRHRRGRDPRLPFWSILSFLRRPYATLIVFVAMGLLLVGMQLGVASLTRQGINSLVGYDLPAFLVAVAGMFLLLAAEAAGWAWWWASAVDCGAEIASQMRWHLADRLLAAPLHVVERLQPGELGARFTSDITAASALLWPTLSLVHTSFLALGAAVYMIVLDWRIGLATLVAAIVTTKTGEVLSRPISHAAARVQDSYAQMSAFSEQSLANVATVKVFNLEGLLQEGFARRNTATAEVGAWLGRRTALLEAAVWWWAAVPLFIPLGYGGYLVLRGALDPGTVFAILYLSNFTRAPVAELGDLLGEIRRALGSAEGVLRLQGALDEGRQKSLAISSTPRSGEEAARLDRVTFQYADSSSPVLEAVTVSLPRGRVTFVVGESGGGKSTLFKVLAGLYPPTSGTAHVTGVSHADVAGVRVVYVPQEPFLFPWSIRENLFLTRPDPRPEDITNVLEAACAEFLWELPHGLETQLSEDGAPLSGGQKIRLCIARALLAGPSVLLLDEPSANLDPLSEEELLRRLRRFMHGKTLGIVTHRLGLIGDQDWVIVLQDRRVAAQGYHAELLQRSPLYAAMQSEFRDDGDPR